MQKLEIGKNFFGGEAKNIFVMGRGCKFFREGGSFFFGGGVIFSVGGNFFGEGVGRFAFG